MLRGLTLRLLLAVLVNQRFDFSLFITYLSVVVKLQIVKRSQILYAWFKNRSLLKSEQDSHPGNSQMATSFSQADHEFIRFKNNGK